MDQQRKYEAVKECVDHHGNKDRIAATFGVSKRTVNRWIKGYQESGKEFFVHGNTGRSPATKITEDVRQKIISLYQSDIYFGCNLQYFSVLLRKYEGIDISDQSVVNILESTNIYSPKMWRRKKNRIRKEQAEKRAKEEALKQSSENDDDTNQTAPGIDKSLISPEYAHSYRARCKYYGELVQMDASSLNWFGAEITHLHLAVDDSTGQCVGAYFDHEETLHGYYGVLKYMLLHHGAPLKILTDKRTVFEYTRKNGSSQQDFSIVENDTYTQFSYACSILGTEIITTSVPQTKGRIERLNETAQGRLPFEFRKKGITDIDAANEYLATHLDELLNDERDVLPVDHIKSPPSAAAPDSRMLLWKHRNA